MKNCSSIKAGLLIGIIILLISSIVAPVVIGFNVRTSDNKMLATSYKPDRYIYPEFYDCYNISEIADYEISVYENPADYDDSVLEVIESGSSPQPLDGPPMDSPWPMYCHDVRHTGRSPYSTANNSGYEKWRIRLHGLVWGSPIIDDSGIIYIGAWDFYAIYPNGTIKWQIDIDAFSSAGAIDENGIIYVGTIWAMPNYLYAIDSNDGTLKWKYQTSDIYSSPAIGNDGTIYFGDSENWCIKALYPNGTLKWAYKTDYVVYSSPAIGEDGTVYCGSHDTYLYALYPNNGSIKWKYKTGHWIRTSPCIADDGTIYVVSLDDHLHAVYLNGTLKWKTNMGEGGTSPTIGQDGTIYCGYTQLHAINPANGSVKWKFDVLGKIRGATPCNSIDGTNYLGNYDGSDIVAVNPDGTEKWRLSIGGDVESAPAIGEDGTVYIGDGRDDGCLHAFGPLDSDAPSAPDIDGPNRGIPGIDYNFSFVSTEPNNQRIKYYVDWGDGNTIETDYHESGEVVTLNHTWNARETYTIKAIAEDFYGEQSNESSFKITIPRNKVVNFSFNLLSWFLERFPMLERLLDLLIK